MNRTLVMGYQVK